LIPGRVTFGRQFVFGVISPISDASKFPNMTESPISPRADSMPITFLLLGEFKHSSVHFRIAFQIFAFHSVVKITAA